MDFWVFVLVAGVAVAVAAYQAVRRKQRREQLFVLCQERGWSYAQRDDRWVQRLSPFFGLFDQGFGRTCRNVVHISDQDPACTMFDYIYKQRSGSGRNRSTTTYRYAVAVVSLDGYLPTLRIDAENMFTRFGSMMGFSGIELESSDFNRRFRVSADDRTHAFDVLHPRAIDFLLEQDLDNWEIAGGCLVVMTKGAWKLDDYDRASSKLAEFHAMIPDYVWNKHAEPA